MIFCPRCQELIAFLNINHKLVVEQCSCKEGEE